MSRWARKANTQPPPESRLWLSCVGFLLTIVGVVVLVRMQQAPQGKWNITTVIGIAVVECGNQIVTTLLIAYAIHCPTSGLPALVFSSVSCGRYEASSSRSDQNGPLPHLLRIALLYRTAIAMKLCMYVRRCRHRSQSRRGGGPYSQGELRAYHSIPLKGTYVATGRAYAI